MSMPAADLDDDVDSTYLSIFSEHLADFREHLAGRDPEVGPLPASFFAPRAFWTAAEKDAFFKALAVHSRLRPDLIAEEVKTKTIPDVCVYLAMLERAAKEMPEAATYVRHNGQSVDVKLSRKELPAALEVSDEWIDYEEHMATSMIILDRAYESDVVSGEREEEVNSRRSTVRAWWGAGRTASNERDRAGEKERREAFEQWLAQRKAEWEGEDLLLSLDKVDLATLDRMLRDDEEGRAFQLESVGDRTLFGTTEVDDTRPPDISEDLIDPVLLQLSQPRAQSRSPDPSEIALGDMPTTLPPHENIPLPPLSQPQRAYYFDSTLTPAHLVTSDVEAPAVNPTSSTTPSVKTDEGTLDGEDPSQMSPASRRRYQKRLYMRRKRAKETGAPVIENAERLKPGRKPKNRAKKATPATEEAQQDAATPSVAAEDEDRSAYRHPNVSGRTLPYKRQLDFVSKGVDVPRLRREGLDLFHLQGVSRLMQTYNELHDVDSTIASEISADTLRLLRALVVRFVSQAMSRAIISKEQERIAKLQTKAWRLKENQVVSSANVKHALALFGAESLSKRAHFARLLQKLDLEEDEDEETEDEDRQSQHPVSAGLDDDVIAAEVEVEDVCDDGSDVEDTRLPLEPPPLLRMIFPPFMHSPSSGLHFGDAPDELDPSVYMPWPSSSLLSTASEPPRDEDLLPEELDEGELTRELTEDKTLEWDDNNVDKQGQEALWVRVGRIVAGPASTAEKPMAEEKPEPSCGRAAERPPRKRRRKASENGERKDDGSADERDVEAELLGDATNADDDDPDAVEEAAPRGARKKRKLGGTTYLSQHQLRFQEPDPDGRIKSAVYVLDSD
ncbi:hypothetical protein C8Q74DRAFT_866300 [Fomes fomentarius]|nr:hypothetical protein C8Q74DRAFT_866300 [Fomes fomentarius]